MMYKLTEAGRKKAEEYIKELEAEQRDTVGAGFDTANDTFLPDVEAIESDITDDYIDEDGEYWNNWAVTDNRDSDCPIVLQRGVDFVEA